MKDAYDPAAFRALGHRVVDLCADHLERATAGAGPVLPWQSPADAVAAWPPAFAGGRDLVELLGATLAQSNHLHHPRYVGHQVTAPLPAAALCDLVASLLNNGMAVYEMGPVAVAMERAVVGWMAARLGLPAGADGVLTSGGSAANLTALLAMRQLRGAGIERPAILVAASAHYSVRRAALIMGWGDGGAIAVPVDDEQRLRPDALPAALTAAAAAGRRVIAVAASACSTATGAFDPLPAIADFCRAHDLWLHVDAAHGAAAALSPRHRELVRGIERADSVIWDAHKMLLMPALVSAVLFRDGRASYAPFEQEADYLFGGRPEEAWWDLATRTLECTKRMMSLKLYAALATVGEERLGAYVERMFDLARWFAGRLAAAGFEVVAPQANIVCFRLGDDGAMEEARRALVESGAFYLVKTRLQGKVWLRVTIINPLTTEADLDALAAAVRARVS